jgi:hypothetical protein
MKARGPIRFLMLGSLHAVLLLLALEIAARAEDTLRWGAPFFGEYRQEMLFVTDSLGYHLRPNARFRQWRIDSLGFRGPEVTKEKLPGVTRIITVGASETFGLYEGAGKEWPAQLQTLLDSVRPGRYQVLNAAIPGISPNRIATYFQRWLVRFDPDIVIFYPTPTFVLPPPFASPASPTPRKADAGVNFPSLRILAKARDAYRSVAPRRLQSAARQWFIDREVRRHPADWVITTVPRERVEGFRDQLVELAQVVRESGANFVLATHASRANAESTQEQQDLMLTWRKQYPNRTPTVLSQTETLANEAIRQVAVEHRIAVVDAERLIPKSSSHFADVAHFRDAGAAMLAGAFLQQILTLSAR